MILPDDVVDVFVLSGNNGKFLTFFEFFESRQIGAALVNVSEFRLPLDEQARSRNLNAALRSRLAVSRKSIVFP